MVIWWQHFAGTYPGLGVLQIFWGIPMLAACWGWGRRWLKRWGIVEVDDLAHQLFALGLGYMALAFLVFVLASVGQLRLETLGALSAFWLIGAARPWLESRKFWATLRVRWWWWPMLMLAIINYLPALLPAIDWDGPAYHLALPKIYLQAGGFVFRPDIYHNLFPQMMEMLYTLGFIFPFQSAGKVFHWAAGCFTALTLYCLVRPRVSRWVAGLTALAFYYLYPVHLLSATAYVDLGFTWFAALALLAFQISRARQVYLGLGFFFLGAMAAIKWHGLVIAGLAALVYWGWRWRSGLRFSGAGIWGSLLLPGWALLPVLPFMQRNTLLTGNPVWPFGYPLLPHPGWDAGADARAVANGHIADGGGAHPLWDLLALPWRIWENGRQFGMGGEALAFPVLAWFFCLGLVVFWMLARKVSWGAVAARKCLWAATAVAIGYTLIWALTSPVVRYLLPIFLVLFWATALVWQKLWDLRTPGSRALAIITMACFFIMHPPLHRVQAEQGATLLGLRPAADYLRAQHAPYAAIELLNRVMQPEERVFLYGENRGFYLDHPYRWGNQRLQADLYRDRYPDPASLHAFFKQNHFHWLLYCEPSDLDYYDPDINHLVRATAEAYGIAVWLELPYAVYYFP